MKRILTLVFCALFLCSCGEEKKEEPATVQPVTCAEMKELQKDGAILIDVRTAVEYKAESIDGAINITVEDIGNAVTSMFEDKNTKIIILQINKIIFLFLSKGVTNAVISLDFI